MPTTTSTEAPVAIIIYNRADYSAALYEKLQELKPSRLYIIADGPKNQTDYSLCQKTRSVFDTIGWDCHVTRIFSETNLGCGARVFSGLNEVFRAEDRAIILEDDCIPSQPFFSFCNEVLEKFKDDSRFMHISGSNFTPERSNDEFSCVYSKYGHIWGWATWKRAWSLFDYQMSDWPVIREKEVLKYFFHSRKEYNFFLRHFDTYFHDPSKPWGYRWMYARLINNGISVIPKKNLITNIGADGTYNTSGINNKSLFKQGSSDFAVEQYPPYSVYNNWFDDYHFEKHIYYRKNYRLKSRLNKLLKRPSA